MAVDIGNASLSIRCIHCSPVRRVYQRVKWTEWSECGLVECFITSLALWYSGSANENLPLYSNSQAFLNYIGCQWIPMHVIY